MKRFISVSSLLLCLFVLNEQVFATEKIDVLTTISMGTSNIDLTIAESLTTATGTFNGDTRDITINPNIPGAELGLTVLDDKIYYGVNMYLSGLNVARYNLRSFDNYNRIDTNSSRDTFVSRASYSVFSGYSYQDNVNLYAGVSFSKISYGEKVSIDEVAPFVGASYAWRFTVSSSMNFDVAYSLANSKVNILNTEYIGDRYTITSTNRSLSYSASWLLALDRGRSFFVRFKVIDLNLSGTAAISSKITTAANNTGQVTIRGSQVQTQFNIGMGF